MLLLHNTPKAIPTRLLVLLVGGCTGGWELHWHGALRGAEQSTNQWVWPRSHVAAVCKLPFVCVVLLGAVCLTRCALALVGW